VLVGMVVIGQKAPETSTRAPQRFPQLQSPWGLRINGNLPDERRTWQVFALVQTNGSFRHLV